LDSVIIIAFPQILVNLKGKHLTLLWRGTRDGFGSDAFHERCDGHANTVTLVESDGGFIFGGFTPVPWESRAPPEYEEDEEEEDKTVKADETAASYLFSLSNPSATPPRAFPIIPEMSSEAIVCGRKWGPRFGKGDLMIGGNGNVNTESRTRGFGTVYANTTKRDGKTFFTGMAFFTVREVEVFEFG
jgi:hypothetical protein